MSKRIGFLRRAARGGKLAQVVENSERQNITASLVTQLLRTCNNLVVARSNSLLHQEYTKHVTHLDTSVYRAATEKDQKQLIRYMIIISIFTNN